ncbi:MAG: hypothetical protein ACRYG5_14035 [Janthinobacterium lividum]
MHKNPLYRYSVGMRNKISLTSEHLLLGGLNWSFFGKKEAEMVMPERSFSFMAAQDVTALSQDLFRKSGINCFSYSRVYPDRSRTELWTDPGALRHSFLVRKYIVGAYTPTYYIPEERYSVLDSKIETFPPEIRERYINQVRDQRVLFDHAKPFKIINKTDKYCEYFIFMHRYAIDRLLDST